MVILPPSACKQTIVALCATFLLSCQYQGSPPGPNPKDSWADHQPHEFRVVGENLREGRLREARRSLDAILSDSGESHSSSTWVLGLAAFEKKRYRQTLRSLDLTVEEQNPFEDWRLLALAESAHATGDLAQTQIYLDALERAHPDTPLRPEALSLRLHLPLERQTVDSFNRDLDAFRQFLVPRPLAISVERQALLAAAHYRDSSLLESSYRRLVVDLVADQEPQLARALLEVKVELSSEEILTRAQNLMTQRRYRDALECLELTPSKNRGPRWIEWSARLALKRRVWSDLLELLPQLPESDDPERSLQRGKLLIDAARARRSLPSLSNEQLYTLGFEALSRAEASGQKDLIRESLTYRFRAHLRRKEPQKAVEIFHRFHQLEPTDHRLVDDLWSLAWSAWRKGETATAMHRFEEILHLEAQTNRRRAAEYWLGRCLRKLGSNQRALEVFRNIARGPIDDFYGRQAQNQLEHPERLQPVEVPSRNWPRDSQLKRVELLLALGLDSLARRELALLEGSSEPRAVSALQARILAAEGHRRKVIAPLKRTFPGLGTPDEVDLSEEVLAHYYPLAYAEEIREWARVRDLPPSLVFALIRQESAFDRRATSRAGARGLMQLMPATARELARKERLTLKPLDLWNPEYSVRLGTRYLKEVLELFGGDLELALAGYNGGPYRIRRWWRKTRDPKDEFIENLRLSESRTYVKRVLLLDGSYRRLYETSVPPEEDSVAASTRTR